MLTFSFLLAFSLIAFFIPTAHGGLSGFDASSPAGRHVDVRSSPHYGNGDWLGWGANTIIAGHPLEQKSMSRI